jgi:cytochrome bd ubiquinol oxidase subunit II
MSNPSTLQIVWFALISVLWIGYFFLEGFDFGVGMLFMLVGKDDVERRMAIRTIGPVWDGNEVWLIVAGGATFAAFPLWYATMFSAFYLPLALILATLILRGVAFEFRHQSDTPRWRAAWDWALFAGSLVPALLWGVAFANIVQGVPIDAHHTYTGTLLDLLHPYALLGGLTFAGVFLLHGASFLALKLTGDPARRAEAIGQRIGWVVTGLLLAFLAWTFANAVNASNTGVVPGPVPVVAIALVACCGPLIRARMPGWAFSCTGLGIALMVATLFLNLYPRVMVSSTNAAYSLTVTNASSTNYTLTVMTVVAGIFTPLVLVYQAWTYWVFRQRVTRDEFELPKMLHKKEPAPAPPGS